MTYRVDRRAGWPRRLDPRNRYVSRKMGYVIGDVAV